MRKRAFKKGEKRNEGEILRRTATPETPSSKGRKSSSCERKVEVAMETLVNTHTHTRKGKETWLIEEQGLPV